MAGMEKHASHGRIVEDFPRVPQAIIDRLAKHDTAKICDSMGGHGAMHYEIKPLDPGMRVIGSALTGTLMAPGPVEPKMRMQVDRVKVGGESAAMPAASRIAPSTMMPTAPLRRKK